MRNEKRSLLVDRIAGALPLDTLSDNPFTACTANRFTVDADSVQPDAPEGSYEYRLVPAAPPVAADECELPSAAIEVRVLWGKSVLHVTHLEPSASFWAGEIEDGSMACDFFMPKEMVGGARVPLVVAGLAIVPPGASAVVRRGERAAERLDQVIALGIAKPWSEMAGAHAIALADGTSVRIDFGDVAVELTGTKQGKKSAAAFSAAAMLSGAFVYTLGSLVGHAGLLAAMAALTPPLGATADESMTDEQRYLVEQYLDVQAANELDARETEQMTTAEPTESNGGTGTAARGESGVMGTEATRATDGRYAIARQQDDADPAIARAEAIRMARDFGVIGLLNAGGLADPNAPTAPWGGLFHNGDDPISAQGNMWGSSLADAYGPGGLGLSGVGEGGDGKGEGIGLGPIGTYGHGSGLGIGQDFGNGRSTGRLPGRHRVKVPTVRMTPPSVSGRIPPEVIQRIVRQNYGRFRACYENGLRNNPSLTGRVAVAFVIGRDGRVSNVSGGGDIPDSGVVSCITRSFYGLSFPQPDGGIVTVRYPLMLTPGG